MQSYRSEHTFNPYASGLPAGPQAQMEPPAYYAGAPNPRQSYIGPAISPGMAQSGGAVDLVRRRSIQSNRSEALKGPSAVPTTASAGSDGTTLPSDEELLMEIRHILSTSDLMTITKKKVRQQLGKFFGVDLSAKKDYIHECIDSILKGEL